MASISLSKVLFAVVVLAMGSHAGQIPSCQQQLLTTFISSFDLSVLNPTCIKKSFPGLDELNVSALLQRDSSCSELIGSLQSIADLIVPILNNTKRVCRIGYNPIRLVNAQVKLNILGLTGVDVSVRDISIQALPILTAVASLEDESPVALGVEVESPIFIKAKMSAVVPVGHPVSSVPVNADVTITGKIKFTLDVDINDGVVSVAVAGPSVCSVDDIDYPIGSVDDLDYTFSFASGLLKQSTTLSLVSTVSVGLADAVAILLGNFGAALVKIAIDVPLGTSSD